MGASGCIQSLISVALHCGIEIAVPEVEADLVLAPAFAPELFGGEGHGVEMLRAGPVAPRLAVGKAEDAVIGLDDAVLAAGIARQAGVSGRMNIAGGHRISELETRDD